MSLHVSVCASVCIWPFTHYLSLKRSLFLSKASDDTMEHIWTLHPSQLVFSLVWRISKRGHPYRHFSCNPLDKAASHHVLLPTKAGGGGSGIMCPILLRNLFGRTCEIGPWHNEQGCPQDRCHGQFFDIQSVLLPQFSVNTLGILGRFTIKALWPADRRTPLKVYLNSKAKGAFHLTQCSHQICYLNACVYCPLLNIKSI